MKTVIVRNRFMTNISINNAGQKKPSVINIDLNSSIPVSNLFLSAFHF